MEFVHHNAQILSGHCAVQASLTFAKDPVVLVFMTLSTLYSYVCRFCTSQAADKINHDHIVARYLEKTSHSHSHVGQHWFRSGEGQAWLPNPIDACTRRKVVIAQYIASNLKRGGLIWREDLAHTGGVHCYYRFFDKLYFGVFT